MNSENYENDTDETKPQDDGASKWVGWIALAWVVAIVAAIGMIVHKLIVSLERMWL